MRYFFLLSILNLISISTLYGWGSYGHQQINVEAIELIEKSPLGICLAKNKTLIQRYATTPDMEWKFDPRFSHDSDPNVMKDWKRNNVWEHEAHFFEVDTFLPPEALANQDRSLLGESLEYEKNLPNFAGLAVANFDTLMKLNPGKKIKNPAHPANLELLDFGHSPWRIVQLMKMAIEALNLNTPESISKALFYLGTLGHYTGDASQPMHGSANYNGQTPAGWNLKGVHGDYEEDILEKAAKGAKNNNGLWSKFESSQPAMEKYLQGVKIPNLTQAQIIGAVYDMAMSGQPLLMPVLVAYRDAKAAQKQDAAMLKAFSETQIEDPRDHSKKTVLESAYIRMAQGALLTASIWNAAWELSNKPANIENCRVETFDRRLAITNYVMPKYLPNDVQNHFNDLVAKIKN